jgi:hypothetical protein
MTEITEGGCQYLCKSLYMYIPFKICPKMKLVARRLLIRFRVYLLPLNNDVTKRLTSGKVFIKRARVLR